MPREGLVRCPASSTQKWWIVGTHPRSRVGTDCVSSVNRYTSRDLFTHPPTHPHPSQEKGPTTNENARYGLVTRRSLRPVGTHPCETPYRSFFILVSFVPVYSCLFIYLFFKFLESRNKRNNTSRDGIFTVTRIREVIDVQNLLGERLQKRQTTTDKETLNTVFPSVCCSQTDTEYHLSHRHTCPSGAHLTNSWTAPTSGLIRP